MRWDVLIVMWLGLLAVLVITAIRRSRDQGRLTGDVSAPGVCRMPGCRHRNNEFAEFCAKCGARLLEAPPSSDSQTKS